MRVTQMCLWTFGFTSWKLSVRMNHPWTKRVGDAVHCKFCLAANNYMPRKASCEGELAYLVFADTREELVELIKEHIIPLYENALSILNEMCNGSKSCLYYWKRH